MIVTEVAYFFVQAPLLRVALGAKVAVPGLGLHLLHFKNLVFREELLDATVADDEYLSAVDVLHLAVFHDGVSTYAVGGIVLSMG